MRAAAMVLVGGVAAGGSWMAVQAHPEWRSLAEVILLGAWILSLPSAGTTSRHCGRGHHKHSNNANGQLAGTRCRAAFQDIPLPPPMRRPPPFPHKN